MKRSFIPHTPADVYVDNLVITGASNKEVQHSKAEMKAQFKMSTLGLLSFYLGIKVHQCHITASQGSYTKIVSEVVGLANCNAAHTLVEEMLKLTRQSEGWMPHYTNDLLAGSTISARHGRYVSRFLQCPAEEHMVAVKCILCYIAGTLHFGCFYTRGKATLWQHNYSDSDLANDIDTSKSTPGGIFFLGDGPVSWHSLNQSVVALSLCEAVYVSTSAASQAVWLARLLGDLTRHPAKTFELKMDNMSVLALIKNPVFHDKSKHTRIKYHYVCLKMGASRPASSGRRTSLQTS
jgi:hypothetical protein